MYVIVWLKEICYDTETENIQRFTRIFYFGEYGEADPYYILADFPSYIETYEKVYRLYVDHKDEWIKKAVVNTAKSGYFSSDRTIEQYNEKIWNLKPVK